MTPREELIEKLKSFVFGKKRAYCQIFNPENQFFRTVMADLAKFCRANESTMDADPRIHALLEGRREVWLRITRFLNLTDQELWKIYGKEYE